MINTGLVAGMGSIMPRACGGALRRIVAATDTVAARFVVVDAVDEEAQAFYAHHGFRAIPSSLRLVQKVSDIAAAVSRPIGPG